jgi:hypothetical protein
MMNKKETFQIKIVVTYLKINMLWLGSITVPVLCLMQFWYASESYNKTGIVDCILQHTG